MPLRLAQFTGGTFGFLFGFGFFGALGVVGFERSMMAPTRRWRITSMPVSFDGGDAFHIFQKRRASNKPDRWLRGKST